MTETYKDIQNLINEVTWQFYKRYGGDLEEWKAEANLTFVRTCSTHRKNKGAFSTWLYFCIWKSLLTHVNILYKQSPRIIKGKEDEDIIKSLEDKRKFSFSSLELLDGMQEDTKTVVNLILNPPNKLKNAKIKNGSHPCHMKVVLRRHLFNLGWTGKRIKESFEEIIRIIND